MVDLNDKCIILDKVLIEHKNGLTGVITRRYAHSCWETKIYPNGKVKRSFNYHGFIHQIALRLHLTHNSMTNYGTGGIYDVVSLVSGIAAPAAYTYIGIGTGTANDSSSDTAMTGSSTYSKTVTPTRANSSGSLGDEIQWTHVFSQANDSSLTGTWNVQEVAIQNAASNATGHMLLHIAGSNYAASSDQCIWGNGDTLTITITCKFEQGT
jgi:hypothetical protein